MGRSWDRLGAAGGLLGVALSLGGFAMIGAAGFALSPPASTLDVAEALQQGSIGLARVGIFIDVLGSLFFILFIARLWATLRQAEGHPAWFSVTVFAAGLLMVVAGLGDKIAYQAIVVAAEAGAEAQEAAPLFHLVSGSFLLFQAFAGFFLVATGIATLRTAAFPRWLGWAGIVIGLLALGTIPVPPAAVGMFPFLVLALAAFSVALLRRPLEVAAPPSRG
jgi:hypothetical protein